MQKRLKKNNYLNSVSADMHIFLFRGKVFTKVNINSQRIVSFVKQSALTFALSLFEIPWAYFL